MSVPAGTAARTVRMTVLHPDRLNLYADRGNVLVIAERCRRRGIRLEVTAIRIGDPIGDIVADLIYIGGGQDREQAVCADDLRARRPALVDAIAAGATLLGICGGYQLLGHEYATGNGTLTGLGLLDVSTSRSDDHRLVGNVVVDVDTALPVLRGGDVPPTLVGFENHQGRTTLGSGVRPLGTVRVGAGNNGHDATEGAYNGTVIGTYLHGPLFAKNVWFADALIERAVGAALAPLPDGFEHAVHVRALSIAQEHVAQIARGGAHR